MGQVKRGGSCTFAMAIVDRKKVKIFKERISLYGHLDDNTYIHGFFKTLQVQLTIFLIYIVIRDSYRARSVNFEVLKDAHLLGSLRDWLIFTGLECIHLLSFLLIYFFFLVWIKLRNWFGKVANILYLIIYVAYFCGSLYLVSKVVHGLSLALIPRFIAFVEQLRLCMKSYSFIRENAYKVLYPWHKDDQSGPAVWYAGQMSPQVGSFTQYVYFLFAPTLLYRDHYPRNRGSINWSNVFIYGVSFLLLLFVSIVVFMEFQYPKSMKLDDLVEAYVVIYLASPVMLYLCSVIVLHTWFNFTAEITRFADREFYQGWWFAVGYTEFYRTWNVPIFDFLGQYVYQDIRSFFPPCHSVVGLITILASSVTHDYLAAVGTGLYFPTFIVLFALIGGVVFVSRVRFSKYLTFFFTCLGVTLIQGFYYTELAARSYCPEDNNGSVWIFKTPACFKKYNMELLSYFEYSD